MEILFSIIFGPTYKSSSKPVSTIISPMDSENVIQHVYFLLRRNIFVSFIFINFLT